MVNLEELCKTIRDRMNSTIRLPDGTVQYADLVAADVIEELQTENKMIKDENEQLKRKLYEIATDMLYIAQKSKITDDVKYAERGGWVD